MLEIKLTDLIDVAVLQKLQDEFSKFTGMAALTTDAKGVPVTKGSGFTEFCTELVRKTELGCKRCNECDRNGAIQSLNTGRPSVYVCHAGLIDFAAPIMVDGELVGSFIGGQVHPDNLDEEYMTKKAVEMGIDPAEYIEAANRTFNMSKRDVEKAAEFLFDLSKILSDMAYNGYFALQHSRQLERAARSQTEYVVNMSQRMQKQMGEWMKKSKEALESNRQDIMTEAITDILTSGVDVYSSVEDSINYIKTSSGTVVLIETEYNLREMIKHTVADTKCDVQVVIDDNVPEYLLGDSGRIGQVIIKLCRVLSTVMNGERIALHIACKRESYASMLDIRVYCIESVSEDVIQKINYYISGGETYTFDSDCYSGLSYVSNIVQQMSGTLKFADNEAGGMEFVISLPQLGISGGY